MMKKIAALLCSIALAGCATSLPPVELKNLIQDNNVVVKLPPDNRSIALDPYLDRGRPAVPASHSIDYQIAIDLQRQVEHSDRQGKSTYTIDFDGGSILFQPIFGLSILTNVAMNVTDASGKRVTRTLCWNHDTEHHSWEEWLSNPAFAEGAKNRIAALCLRQFNQALGFLASGG
jgi:hypothetical protein